MDFVHPQYQPNPPLAESPVGPLHSQRLLGIPLVSSICEMGPKSTEIVQAQNVTQVQKQFFVSNQLFFRVQPRKGSRQVLRL